MAETPRSKFPWVAVRFAAFFPLFYLYLRFRTGLHLHFEAHPTFPVFSTNPVFLRDLLTYPGGLIEYVSGYLSQSYHWLWAGPLVCTVVIALICWAGDVLIVAMGGGRARGLAFVPAIILIVAFNQHFSQLQLLVPLLAALLCLLLYLGLARGSDGWRAVTFLILAAGLYYVAGGAFLLFALLVGLYELLAKRRRQLALICLLLVIAIPYCGGMLLSALSLVDAYAWGLPGHPMSEPTAGIFVIACYAYFPLLALGLGIRGAVIEQREKRDDADGGKRKGKRKNGKQPAPRRWPEKLGAVLGSAAILAAAVAAALLTSDAGGHRVFVVDYLARQGRWEEVLAEARRLPAENYTAVIGQHVNRALYELGRLPDEMFSFPQGPHRLMFDTELGRDVETQGYRMSMRHQLWFQLGDLDLQLGLANEAEHEAHEALGVFGPHPEVLRRLAKVNLVKEQPDAARMFLHALQYNVVYGKEAQETLRRMSADPLLSDDPEMARLRSVMLTDDSPGSTDSLERRCLQLLESNPKNRMAFEYLMADYLLIKDLEGFAKQFPRLRDFDYPGIPRHYEEAILLYEIDTSKTAGRAGLRISSEALEDFAHFTNALAACGEGGPDLITAQMLTERHGGSYFLYYLDIAGEPAP